MQQLAYVLQKYFDTRLAGRGRSYYNENRVSIQHITETSVTAKVKGTLIYTVTISLESDTFKVSCTCPFFEDQGLCKHLWAVFEAAQRRGIFTGISGYKTAIETVDPEVDSEEYEPEDTMWGGGSLPLKHAQATKKNKKAERVPDGCELNCEECRYNDPRTGKCGKRDREAEAAENEPDTLFADIISDKISLYNRNYRFCRGNGRKNGNKNEQVWKYLLEDARESEDDRDDTGKKGRNGIRSLIYIAIPERYSPDGNLTINIGDTAHDITIPLRNSPELKYKPIALSRTEMSVLENPVDRTTLFLLFGSGDGYGDYRVYGYGSSSSCRLNSESQTVVLPELLKTNRLFLGDNNGLYYGPYRFDGDNTWRLRIRVQGVSGPDAKGAYTLTVVLYTGDQERTARDVDLVLRSGFIFWKDMTVSRFADTQGIPALGHCRETGSVLIPAKHVTTFVDGYLELSHHLPIELPGELRPEEVRIAPVPVLKVLKPTNTGYCPKNTLLAVLSFRYGNVQIGSEFGTSPTVFDRKRRMLIYRDRAAEQNAIDLLARLECTRNPRYRYSYRDSSEDAYFAFKMKKMVGMVGTLLQSGWKVEGEGTLYRKPGAFSMSVSSGVDWFDLNVRCDFDGVAVQLPQVLAALRKGDPFIQLDDGTMGLLPSEWLEKYASVARMGEVRDDCIRFRRSQALILDMLLAEQPEARVDKLFERVRARLHSFGGITVPKEVPSFTGTLRPYQYEGLGWLLFLREFGFGGILADDMGLGKTIQVLALLSMRKDAVRSGKRAPSLVIVPRSLVFNWKAEAARFTPHLTVFDYSRNGRNGSEASFERCDIVLATYGTVRRDIKRLKDIAFDCVILDEAQAVKNASTQAAKSVRLLNGTHRLALSGTPVENHLGELWSIFEFLNPGMLGSVSAFNACASALLKVDRDRGNMLHAALRPFILRRTKAKVAADLPEKMEETLYCELEPEQRKLYNELRDYYRLSLQKRVEKVGIGRAQIQILEALLRLRQAACHPGLIDKDRVAEPSAKLEMLGAMLDEVCAENHKALVFSQFTSMLAIVSAQLNAMNIPFAYLDGKTRDRQGCVQRFQNDPECKLFLISLKAGGLGLNLTAAEYVFLLDPWWNPAAEMQAIDRTHRIGQTKRVFAYRIIARDTVEEKVLELQKTKRELAESIISADNDNIRAIGLEELQLLLG